MRALTYHGSKDVRVETVPDPVLQNGDDIVVRITATAISTCSAAPPITAAR